jgi:glutathione synthase/RimK-type ligase-like ATP-grasp enzyme
MKIAYVVGDDDPKDPDPDLDIPFIEDAANQLQIDLDFPNWQDKNVDWYKFDAAVIRSTWNYVPFRDEFVSWSKEVETETKLFNSSRIIEWNTDKKYLLELEKNGIPIIPTNFCSKLDEADVHLNWAFDQANAVAIKPSIGAGARLAGRATSKDEAKILLKKIFDNNRIAMIQPYVESVDLEGEKAIVVIDGKLSHVANKVPALTKGGHGDGAGRAVIDEKIEQIFNIVKSKLPTWHELLYARIDVVELNNSYALMELELTEPWLFMKYRPESSLDLLNAILKRIN